MSSSAKSAGDAVSRYASAGVFLDDVPGFFMRDLVARDLVEEAVLEFGKRQFFPFFLIHKFMRSFLFKETAMFSAKDAEINIKTGYTDMRKQISGLARIAQAAIPESLVSGRQDGMKRRLLSIRMPA